MSRIAANQEIDIPDVYIQETDARVQDDELSGLVLPEPKIQRIKDKRHWSSEMEAIATTYQQRAETNVKAYNFMAQANAKKLGYVNIVSGIFGGLLGLTTIFAIYYGQDSKAELSARTIIGFVVMVLSVLKSAWKSEETQNRITTARTLYDSLNKKIILQLAMPAPGRGDAREFIKNLMSEFNILQAVSPMIDDNTKKKFVHKLDGDMAIKMTDIDSSDEETE